SPKWPRRSAKSQGESGCAGRGDEGEKHELPEPEARDLAARGRLTAAAAVDVERSAEEKLDEEQKRRGKAERNMKVRKALARRRIDRRVVQTPAESESRGAKADEKPED